MESAETTVAVTIANGLAAQARLPMKHRLHGAVLGKDRVLRGAVPVHFTVKIVAVQPLCSRREEVICVPGPGHIRQGNQSNDLFRDGVARHRIRCWPTDGRLIGKSCPTGAVRVARMRVEDRRPGASEISGPKSCSGESLQISAVVALERPVVTSEEEQFVLHDRAAKCASEIVQDALALPRTYRGCFEELPGPQGLVLMILK